MPPGALPEEPWERRIHELLSGLPPVEPPEGFLQQAIDHRPKYAARLSAGAVASVAAAALVLAALGWVGDPAAVAPPVGSLRERHAQVDGGIGAAQFGGSGGWTFERVAERPEVVELPTNYRPLGLHRDGELVQVVYERAGEAVSIFVQEGSIAWDDLPPEGRSRLDDRPVWTDEERRTTVVQVGRYAVCVVGMDVDDALAAFGHAPRDRVTVGDRLRSLAHEVARQAGFP